MTRKMHPSCNHDFPGCTKRHPGIELAIEDFETEDQRDEFHHLLKQLITTHLGPSIASWMILEKTSGDLQNCTDESCYWGKDPHGNRDGDPDKVLKT